MNLQDNNKFDLATDLILNTKCNVFLTGKAGTGKTTFLKGLLKECTEKRIVVAPTGIAAINANGVTMHSFFQLPFHPFLPDAPSVSSEISDTNKEIIRELELLIIDEVSMVRADMLDAIDYRLRTVRKKSEPFGGVQLLLIGDLFQLPPVAVPDEYDMLKEYYDSMFFFESKALKQSDFVTVELDKIFRQDDKEFKDILNSIREGISSRYIIERLNKCYVPDFNPQKDEPYIRLVTHNAQAEKINREEMERLEGKKYAVEATIVGEFQESSYPVPYTLILKEGAHVMTTKNKSGDYCNGSLGVVVSVEPDCINVKLVDGGRIVKIEKETWDNIVYRLKDVVEKGEEGKLVGKKKKEIVEECIGSFTQFPLRPAWAITIHKSQGLSFDRAIIDVSRSFMAGQTYVALSRCRSLDGLVLSEKVDFRAIKCDKTIKEFYKNEAERMPDIEKLDELRKEKYIDSLRSNVGISAIEKEVITMCRLVVEAHMDSTCVDLLLAAHRDFSLSCALPSEEKITSIQARINQTKAYSQNISIQNAIVDLAKSNLHSIKALSTTLTYIEKNIAAKGKIAQQLDVLKFAVILWRSIEEFIVENGFGLLDIQRLLRGYDLYKHKSLNFDGTLLEKSNCSKNTDKENVGVVYNKDVSELISVPKTQTSLFIPNSVTSIRHHACFNNPNLTTVELPDNLATIGDWAFAHCTSLRTITIPASVTIIGEGAFYNCTALSIDIPRQAKIEERAFENCGKMYRNSQVLARNVRRSIIENNLDLRKKEYVTHVKITEIEGECDEADWQECSISATAFVKVEYSRVFEGQEHNLITCTFFAHISLIEEFDEMNEWEIEDYIEEDNISNRVAELSIEDFDGLKDLDFYAQGVPINGNGLSTEDIGRAIASVLDKCEIDWDCGEFQCTKLFSEEEPSGNFDK